MGTIEAMQLQLRTITPELLNRVRLLFACLVNGALVCVVAAAACAFFSLHFVVRASKTRQSFLALAASSFSFPSAASEGPPTPPPPASAVLQHKLN
jgi:hypothetical protein